MKQQYYLKKTGLSFMEQSFMTAEERRWWFETVQKEQEEIKRQLKGTKEL